MKEQAENYDHWTEKQKHGDSFNKSQLILWTSRVNSKAETQEKEQEVSPTFFQEVLCTENESIKKLAAELAVSNPKKKKKVKKSDIFILSKINYFTYIPYP